MVASNQHGRGFAQFMGRLEYEGRSLSNTDPSRLALPEVSDPEKGFYPPHEHKDYRCAWWWISIDASAVVHVLFACYAGE